MTMDSTTMQKGAVRVFFVVVAAAAVFFAAAASSFADSTSYTYDDVHRFIRVESGKLGVTATAGQGGSISNPGNTPVSLGGTLSFTITPNTGYHISDVRVDGVSQGAIGSYTLSNITESHTVEATFAINTYTLTVSRTTSGGTVTGGGISCGGSCSATYNYGTSVTLSATPDTAYDFSGWNGACSGAGSCVVTMDSDKSVTANLPMKTFTITASTDGKGVISPSGALAVNYGSSQTYSISSPVGYAISDVVVDGFSVGAVSSYTFSNVTTGPHSISATFSCSSNPFPVRVVGSSTTYYSTLQAAYNGANSGDVIEAHGIQLNESLVSINKNITVTLQGGYTCDYSSFTGNTTTLKGQMQTYSGGGTLTISNFMLSQ